MTPQEKSDIAFARALAVRYTRGRGVDMDAGPDDAPLFPHFQPAGATRPEAGWDFAFWRAVPGDVPASLDGIRDGGHACIACPPGGGGAWIEAAGSASRRWTAVEHVRMPTMDFLAARLGGRRNRVRPWRSTGLECLVVRYGGFGDHIMACSPLPLLKADGWRITYQTTPRGVDIVTGNPHIDDLWVQDEDQVPNIELGGYWHALGRRFDRIVNLSESVEGAWLAMPGRTPHEWPDAVRRKRLGTVNYLEHAHDLAGVPYRFAPTFFPSPEERSRSRAWVRQRHAPVVLWALAGSSVHKVYPFIDAVLARLFRETAAHVVTVGDALCQVLEHGWQNEPRMHPLSGRLALRDTLALLEHVDVAVGNETGAMAAAAFLPCRKVLLLSHSSRENLPKHWTNTVALAGDVPCWPCNRMHFDRTWCPQDEATGAAACQAAIPPADVFAAIAEALPERKAA